MIGGLFVDGFFVDEEREIIQNFVGTYEAEYGKNLVYMILGSMTHCKLPPML